MNLVTHMTTHTTLIKFFPIIFFMKFKATPYHFDLIKDDQRLSAFFEAIKEYDGENELAYDLGCGSGILSYFLSAYFKEVISLEIDKSAFDCAKENLAGLENVDVINTDVLKYDFDKKADLIVCEMMDTALIDEEQIPVLNHAKQGLRPNGRIIPQGIINSAQLVNLEREYIHWDENAKYEIYSDDAVFSEFNFSDDINPNFNADLSFKVKKDGTVNGIKITTFTKLTDDIICGPTPMLNPPLLIPFDEKSVKSNQYITVNLKYIMGNGIESIELNVL